MIKKFNLLVCLTVASLGAAGQSDFPVNPDSVTFHTEDIDLFWKVFDETKPRFNAKTFQTKYLDAGSEGLKGFINMRIESGSNLSKIIKKNLDYYTAVRESTLSITGKTEKIQEYFYTLKKLYYQAVFPDVYFVIGAKNTGGTTFQGGLIIGAEMFGKETETFKPRINIETLELMVVHELVHYQQNYTPSNTLLAQSIREGTADFICELITGSHPYTALHKYGNSHELELWAEFKQNLNSREWTPWLYYKKDDSRPKDLGYWMGYKIVKAYYDKIDNKEQAIYDILNITDFDNFLTKSGYPDNKN
jgi:hypothetical protein